MHKLSHSSNDRRALKRRLDAVRKFVKPLLEVDIPGISEQPQIPVYRDVILVSNPHDLKADLIDTIINSSDPSERMSALAYLITIVKFFKIERTVMDDLHLNNEHFSEISNLLDNACKTILRNIIDGIKDLNKELWFNLLAWPFRLGSAVFTVGAIYCAIVGEITPVKALYEIADTLAKQSFVETLLGLAIILPTIDILKIRKKAPFTIPNTLSDALSYIDRYGERIQAMYNGTDPNPRQLSSVHIDTVITE